MTDSFISRRNQYIQLVKVLYCKLLTIGKKVPFFPHRVRGLNLQPQRWEASVLPLHHHGPALSLYPIHTTGGITHGEPHWDKKSLSLDHHLMSVCDLASQWLTVPILMHPTKVVKSLKLPASKKFLGSHLH